MPMESGKIRLRTYERLADGETPIPDFEDRAMPKARTNNPATKTISFLMMRTGDRVIFPVVVFFAFSLFISKMYSSWTIESTNLTGRTCEFVGEAGRTGEFVGKAIE